MEDYKFMHILILSGSKNRLGQTARAIDAVSKGIVNAGGKSEIIFLPELKLERCRQCENDGWGICRREGRCIIDDDLLVLITKIDSADVIVFANPVYFGDLSESMRSFLDRLRRVYLPKMILPPSPGMPPLPHNNAKSVIGICYAGGSGFGTASCGVNLERMLQTCGFDVVDMILVRRQNLDVKIPMLEMTGKWLVSKPESGPFIPPPIPEK
jgi:NAD(P)H-dependent FMN reductase